LASERRTFFLLSFLESLLPSPFDTLGVARCERSLLVNGIFSFPFVLVRGTDHRPLMSRLKVFRTFPCRSFSAKRTLFFRVRGSLLLSTPTLASMPTTEDTGNTFLRCFILFLTTITDKEQARPFLLFLRNKVFRNFPLLLFPLFETSSTIQMNLRNPVVKYLDSFFPLLFSRPQLEQDGSSFRIPRVRTRFNLLSFPEGIIFQCYLVQALAYYTLRRTSPLN